MGGARKKRTIIEEVLPSEETPTGEPSDFDVSLESVEDSETLQEVLSQFGETNVQLKILRQTAGGSEFCYTTDVLDEEFIQKNFGGGDYSVRVFINGRYKKTIKVKIANRLLSNAEPRSTLPSTHDGFLEKLLLTVLSREQTSHITPVSELAAAMSELHKLNPPATADGGAMGMFLKGVEFAKDLNGSTDWKSSLISTAKEVLPGIVEGFKEMRQPPNPNPPPPHVVPVNDGGLALLKNGITYLKRKAIANVDPLLYVDLVASSADEEQYQLLIRAVLTKDFSEFITLDPEIGTEPFLSWFRSIYDGLRSAFSSANSVDDDSAGDLGDTDNTGNHGANGAGRAGKLEPRKVG